MFALLSSGCPAALFLFLFSHLGTDRLRGGWMTGAGAEVAKTQKQKENERKRREGGGGWSQWGRKTQLLLSMVDSHNKWGGTRFHTESDSKRESSPKGRWKHREGGGWGLTIHKHTGWRSPVVAGWFTQVQHSPHACTITPINKHTLIRNAYEDTMAAADFMREE